MVSGKPYRTAESSALRALPRSAELLTRLVLIVPHVRRTIQTPIVCQTFSQYGKAVVVWWLMLASPRGNGS